MTLLELQNHIQSAIEEHPEFASFTVFHRSTETGRIQPMTVKDITYGTVHEGKFVDSNEMGIKNIPVTDINVVRL